MKIKIRTADKTFSRWLRKKRNWTCERCLKREVGGMQCSHYFGRVAESVRFDEENVDVLCFTDHQYFTANPNEYHAYKLKKLGEERLKKLTVRWATIQKRDDKKILIWLKSNTD